MRCSLLLGVVLMFSFGCGQAASQAGTDGGSGGGGGGTGGGTGGGGGSGVGMDAGTSACNLVTTGGVAVTSICTVTLQNFPTSGSTQSGFSFSIPDNPTTSISGTIELQAGHTFSATTYGGAAPVEPASTRLLQPAMGQFWAFTYGSTTVGSFTPALLK